jgi:hypothetical protein
VPGSRQAASPRRPLRRSSGHLSVARDMAGLGAMRQPVACAFVSACGRDRTTALRPPRVDAGPHRALAFAQQRECRQARNAWSWLLDRNELGCLGSMRPAAPSPARCRFRSKAGPDRGASRSAAFHESSTLATGLLLVARGSGLRRRRFRISFMSGSASRPGEPFSMAVGSVVEEFRFPHARLMQSDAAARECEARAMLSRRSGYWESMGVDRPCIRTSAECSRYRQG